MREVSVEPAAGRALICAYRFDGVEVPGAGRGWAAFYLDDTHGTLALVSDWGTWSHRWGRGTWLGESQNLSDALRRWVGADYVARKLFYGVPDEFDGRATVKDWRVQVLELTAAELLELPEAKENELTESTLYYRLKRMSAEAAVSTPKNVGGARKRARKAKPSRAAPTKPRVPETSSVSALRVVLYANGVEVAESSVVTTWLETMQRIQAEAG
ncbi:MAG: hypothetical protein SangKO_010780 [Sandaracinaceae bacterium]